MFARMSSIASLVAADGPLKLGCQPGADVRALQLALSQAGYRSDITSGAFSADTDYWVRQFQRQHGLGVDGVVGKLTAQMLDRPHADLVASAAPLTKTVALPRGETMVTPHDDTASLIAFYGHPWENNDLITLVIPPFPITYEGEPAHHIPFHVKAAPALERALEKIGEAAKADPSILKHVSKWSGSGNYRPVRGSSRLSTHAFWAANDFDAENLPLGHGVPASEMPQTVVDIFKSTGAFWGGDYIGRKDPMHFQYAHE